MREFSKLRLVSCSPLQLPNLAFYVILVSILTRLRVQLRTNRTGHASSVLGNVRARHNELQRIEQTISELNILFQELATVVEQQETTIIANEVNAENTTQNLEKGIEQTDKAKEHAARARRLKWWCLLVVVLIILAVALGVGLGVGLAKNATS
jgi:syntaxin 1B/2/3